MPRPRSDSKRTAILEAATRIIVTQGLSAPTAGIAKEAGIANGSLFTYFETKTDLFNQLYLELKSEMAATALEGSAAHSELRSQFFQVWKNWTHWAVSFPAKRRALAQLAVSGEITPDNRAKGSRMLADLAALVEQSRAKGPMRKAPLAFVFALLTSAAEATMDFMTQDPANSKQHCEMGFEAVWRILA